ncbi:MAG: acetyl-CoA carboxylase biotin carboxyl carrier protein, partial [Terriglobia bacterium]
VIDRRYSEAVISVPAFVLDLPGGMLNKTSADAVARRNIGLDEGIFRMPAKKVRHQEAEGSWSMEEVRELLELLIEHGISEFEMERNGSRIRVRRGQSVESPVLATSAAVTAMPAPAALSSPVPLPQPVAAHPEPTSESPEGLHIIKSPIVGTFYGSPAPSAPPLVNPGDVVQVGQILCIIEAMKLMNEIESEVAGEIVRVYVENGQPVEYGQSLFAIKPSIKK